MRKRRGAINFSGIEKAIVTVKGQNVIIDSDAARIYGVETREVNQAIKNNPDKFPVGYIVEASRDELIKNFDMFKKVRNYPGTPIHATVPVTKNVYIPNGVHGINTQ